MRHIYYPQTKHIEVIDEHLGHTIVDPYRWLESDVRSDANVAGWVSTQNAGVGMPLDRVIALHADMCSFAAHWTGLEADQAEGDQIEL